MSKEILFSGIQPTGKMHLGNYFGAILPFIQLQDMYDSYLCIADLHSLTAPQNDLQSKTLELAKMLYACGVSKNTKLFVQSNIPQHTELYYFLACNTKMGELERMTQFKVKRENAERENLGLFSYPVLMAADILLYKTDLVPVGQDQKQHLELATLLAKRLNKKYENLFKIPRPHFTEGMKIMSLTDPTSKMSKSDPNPNGVIYLCDSPEDIEKKVKKAVTTDGGVNNLLRLHSLVAGTERFLLRPLSSNSSLKEDLTKRLINLTSEIQFKLHTTETIQIQSNMCMHDPEVLRHANDTINTVKEAIIKS